MSTDESGEALGTSIDRQAVANKEAGKKKWVKPVIRQIEVGSDEERAVLNRFEGTSESRGVSEAKSGS